MRVRLLFVLIATGCAVSAVTACSSSEEAAAEADAKQTGQSSSVTVDMFDKAGNEIGSCSGTLVAKDLVLTAGHCAAGVTSWKITRGSDATSEATRAVTPWKAFGSNLSHPQHSDIALLVLKKPIELDKYPGIASSALPNGARTLHFHRTSATSTESASSHLEVASARAKGFHMNYAAKIAAGEFLDTGGAIIDPKTGKIHGVVSGKGMTSGLLHIARIDNYAKWITKSESCDVSTGLAVRTYGDGSSGGGSSSGGYGGGDWGGGGGDWGGYGGSGKKIDAGGAPPSKDGGTTGGDSGAGTGTPGSPGSPGTAGGGTTGTGSPNGSPGDETDDLGGSGGKSKCPPPPTCEGPCPGAPGSPSGGGAGGAGGSTSSGDDVDTPGSTSGGSRPGKDSSGTEVCPGPPNCPEPDTTACSGASCGGCAGVSGCIDATIDYGSCAACGAPTGSGPGPVVR